MEAGRKNRFDDSRGGEDPPILDIRRSARFPFFFSRLSTKTNQVASRNFRLSPVCLAGRKFS
jgi:hypothetical protein